MNTRNSKKLLLGMAIVAVAIGVTYACKDFLNTAPQGVLKEEVLTTRAGVEGSLIAAYRSLDCSSSSAGSWGCAASNWVWGSVPRDRKSTRLNSSHRCISYAIFCLKKKNDANIDSAQQYN